MNTIKYYEIDLRGRHHRALLQQAAVTFSMLTAIYASREQDRSHRKFGRDTGDSSGTALHIQQQLKQWQRAAVLLPLPGRMHPQGNGTAIRISCVYPVQAQAQASTSNPQMLFLLGQLDIHMHAQPQRRPPQLATYPAAVRPLLG
jgi:hypothetical protein